MSCFIRFKILIKKKKKKTKQNNNVVKIQHKRRNRKSINQHTYEHITKLNEKNWD